MRKDRGFMSVTREDSSKPRFSTSLSLTVGPNPSLPRTSTATFYGVKKLAPAPSLTMPCDITISWKIGYSPGLCETLTQALEVLTSLSPPNNGTAPGKPRKRGCADVHRPQKK